MVIFFTLMTFVSTLCGGLVGLRYRDRMHLILGFTAGVLLAVVSFDILPEGIELINKLNLNPQTLLIPLVLGFLVFHILEKTLLIHHAHEEEYGPHTHPTVGKLSAFALSAHSFLDGMGIGFGFQVSPAVGILVALAVISHDFADGLNTVSMILVHKNPNKTAVKFLLLDAIAPVLGALSTMFFTLPERLLPVYLGFFAGFLLYIGASDILPQAHSKHSSLGTILMTILGVSFIFLITRII